VINTKVLLEFVVC